MLLQAAVAVGTPQGDGAADLSSVGAVDWSVGQALAEARTRIKRPLVINKFRPCSKMLARQSVVCLAGLLAYPRETVRSLRRCATMLSFPVILVDLP